MGTNTDTKLIEIFPYMHQIGHLLNSREITRNVQEGYGPISLLISHSAAGGGAEPEPDQLRRVGLVRLGEGGADQHGDARQAGVPDAGLGAGGARQAQGGGQGHRIY